MFLFLMLAVPPFVTKILLGFRFLGMVFYRTLNMAKSAEHAARPFLASAYRLRRFVREHALADRGVQTGHAMTMQEFTADLKHRMRGVWRDAELVDPNTHNNKLATYHSGFAIPFSRNERMPINVPRYLHLDLSKHVMRNISRFACVRIPLKVDEAAAWLQDGACICDQCPGEDEHVQNEVHALLFCQDHRVCELRKHFPLLFQRGSTEQMS